MCDVCPKSAVQVFGIRSYKMDEMIDPLRENGCLTTAITTFVTSPYSIFKGCGDVILP